MVVAYRKCTYRQSNITMTVLPVDHPFVCPREKYDPDTLQYMSHFYFIKDFMYLHTSVTTKIYVVAGHY